MLDKECIRSIKRFQDPFIRSFIFDSNSWYQFSSKVNQLGNGREQNKKREMSLNYLLVYILHQIQFFHPNWKVFGIIQMFHIP